MRWAFKENGGTADQGGKLEAREGREEAPPSREGSRAQGRAGAWGGTGRSQAHSGLQRDVNSGDSQVGTKASVPAAPHLSS